MQCDKPIKVTSISYRTRSHYINQIQVHLSNGSVSPVFQGPCQADSELKTLRLNDSSLIKKIQGTTEGYHIRLLIFKRADGIEEGRI